MATEKTTTLPTVSAGAHSALERGAVMTWADLSGDERRMILGMRTLVERIAREALTMEAEAAREYIAEEVFEIVERVAEEVSRPFAMEMAYYLTNAIRRRTAH